MIQESYVTFAQAKALKELGFPQNINLYYGLFDDMSNVEDWMEIPINDSYEFSVRDNCEEYYACATLSLVQKWLREEKGLILLILVSEKGSYYPWGDMYVHLDYYDTYEEALSAGIDKCIDLLKENERKDSTESN